MSKIADYWKDLKNRRNFFEEFAKVKRFDALVPTNWYDVSKDDVVEFKVSRSFTFFFSLPLPFLF